MTDAWRRFFIPVPATDPSADDLISIPKIEHGSKEWIEFILGSPAHSKDFPEAMAVLRRMLPDKVWVVSGSFREAANFRSHIQKEVQWVNHPDHLRGLEGAHVVMLGDVRNIPYYREFVHVLSVRRYVTVWDIREW